MRLVLLVIGGLVLYCWATTRIQRMEAYQTPPHPIMHGNYYTYHDMSEQWDLGKRAGTLNATKNGQFNALGNPYLDYSRFASQGDPFYCDYYDLDIGFLFPVDIARRLFGVLPDNYLRTLAFQVVVDLIALFAIPVILFRWGAVPAAAGALLYAWNTSIAMQSALAFYYFWDAMVALAAILLAFALYQHARPRRFRPSAALLGAALGAVLGFGVWLRSSWAVLSCVAISMLLLPRKTRRVAPLVALMFIACSLYPMVRATRLLGHLAFTTRQSWSAAFEALGKDPNPYGLENDDQYLFDLAREKYGAVDTACQGIKRDAALRQEYLAIWNQDPAFVIRSLANRIYLGFTANSGLNPVADRNALILALIGAAWLLFRGGSRRSLALMSLALFSVSTLAICIVYFMTPHYNGVPQICLVLLGIGAFDLVWYVLPWHSSGHRPHVKRRLGATIRLLRRKRWMVATAALALVAIVLTLRQHAVYAYLNVPPAEIEWYPPVEVPADALATYVEDIRALPDAERRELAAVLNVAPGASDAVLTDALKARLRRIVATRDAIRLSFDIDAAAATDVQQAIWHAQHFVSGFSVEHVAGFDIADPSSWSSPRLLVRLREPATVDRIAPIFLPKFTRRHLMGTRSGSTFTFHWSRDGSR